MKNSISVKLGNVGLSRKLTVAYLILGMVTIFSVAFVSYQAFKKALTERTYAQLSSINILKKKQIEDFIQNKARNVQSIAKALVLQEGKGFNESELRKKIVTLKNQYSFSSVTLLDDKSEYLISTDTAIVREIKTSANKVLTDFIMKAHSSFQMKDMSGKMHDTSKLTFLVATPLLLDSSKSGIIIVELNILELGSILYERTGMGKTGESYLVGEDFRMRSQSRFHPETSPLSISVKTRATEIAAKGFEGVEIIRDYRKIDVLSVYRPLSVYGIKLIILSEIDEKEALEPIYKLQYTLVWIGVFILLIFFVITYIVSQKITSPVLRLKSLLDMTSSGILPREIPTSRNTDEIGMMVNATGKLIDALKRTSDFAFEIGNGNFEKEFVPLSNEDILGNSLLQMRDKLKVLTENEIRLIRQNNLKLMEGQEEERKRISRELHDGLGQYLTAIRFIAGEIENEEKRTQILKLLDETISETRRISNNLMPTVLIDFGLEAGLQKLCRQVEESSKIHLSFLYEEDENLKPMPFEVSTNLYRTCQEALNNIVKHSGATEAEVAFFHNLDKVTLEIADNGKGFDINSPKTGYGLKNMKERIQMMKGEITVKSRPERGTVILIELMLN